MIIEDKKLKIKDHPLIPKSIRVSGFVYDVDTGKLKILVYEANVATPIVAT
jgi:hypothetical protein